MVRKAVKKSVKTSVPKQVLHFRLCEGIFIFSLALAVFLLFALLTYHPVVHLHGKNPDIAGAVGEGIAGLFFDVFGYVAYSFPFIFAYAGWVWLQAMKSPELKSADSHLLMARGGGCLLMLLAACALASLRVNTSTVLLHAGGIIGFGITSIFLPLFNYFGATVFLFAALLGGVTLATGLSWLALADLIGRVTLTMSKLFHKRLQQIVQKLYHKFTSKHRSPVARVEPKFAEKTSKTAAKAVDAIKSRIEPTLAFKPSKAEPKIEPEVAIPVIKPKPIAIVPGKVAKPMVTALFNTSTGGVPPLNLLDPPEESGYQGYTSLQLEAMSRAVEEKLHDFGIEVQVVAVHPGPVITRFELQLAPGIKVSRITTLAKDLARSLSVTSVRIVEVIPGKTVVGLELPNEVREVVRLSEILASDAYQHSQSALSIALGKDIAGHPAIVDLAKMPHLLIAGTTGSGKSVGVNAMILSLLYKATPETVRMIMIDPKMLELSIYEGIPHLLTPVVTDMREAANALRWCVGEMERRYRLLAALGVRNLASANSKIKEAAAAGEPIVDPARPLNEAGYPNYLNGLPQIVIIIDEFADMMMVVGKKVEQLIARIAQKARAAGIHMLLATQRPSVDVITGLIKANIPTRIAFQVSSKIDSRTILDQQGAEQLLGNGDMLYMPPGSGVPMRIHGAFVADHEVHKVVTDWKARGEPQYLEEILQTNHETGAIEGADGAEGGEADELYDEAVKIVMETRRASISGIQRRLKIGYNRAARLVEDMERAGLVGAMESNGNREILVPAALEV